MVAGFRGWNEGQAKSWGSIITGLNGNGTNAIAYLLLGTFAAALAQTGLATMLAKWIASVVKERKWILLATLVVCAIISEPLSRYILPISRFIISTAACNDEQDENGSPPGRLRYRIPGLVAPRNDSAWVRCHFPGESLLKT